MVDFAMSAFVTLLLVVDPVGLVPAFLSVTYGMTEQDRTAIAIRSPLIAAVILVTLALCGNWLLRQLGVGIAAFQIAGGLLLFGVSYRMIFGDRPYREAREADRALSEHVSDIAVFPLAIPLMAGPGAITTTLLLSGACSGAPQIDHCDRNHSARVPGLYALFQALPADRQDLGQDRQRCFLTAAWDLARGLLGPIRARWNCCSSRNELLTGALPQV